MRRRKWLVTAGIIILILAGAMILWRLANPTAAVQVTHPKKRHVTELVIASGRLRAKILSNVGSEVTGRVQSVLVDEGNSVKQGQVLINLERSDAEKQLRQAELAADTARRQLQVTERGPLPEEVARARAQLAQAERVGKAKVASARQHLQDLQRGGRIPERKKAQAQLASAHAERVVADADYQRAKRLAAQGAISPADLDKARSTAEKAQASEAAAQQALKLANQPASAEQIAGARADLQAAQADYQESTRIAKENLDLVLRGPRIEDVRLAQAKVQESDAAVAYAQQELAKRTIKSPITGVVTSRTVEPGQSVTPGQTLLVVVDLMNSELYVEVDETDLPKLAVGQPAIAIPPSFPDRPFNAIVSQIGPEVDTERGVVGVRLKPIALPSYARPDMTVDVNIEVANLPSVLSVPVKSVLTQGTSTYVLVAQNGVARRRDVKVLARGPQYVGVKGLKPNDNIIADATQVSPGQRVRAVGGG